MSVAKIGAVIGLIWGLIRAIIPALNFFGGTTFLGDLYPADAELFIAISVISGPILGFVVGAFWSFVYNVVAGFIGPIALDLEAL